MLSAILAADLSGILKHIVRSIVNQLKLTTRPDMCNVAILAGGLGSRLRSRLGDLPKPMAEVGGKPVLHHQIELCKKYGFFNIAFLVHYQHKIISDYFGDGSTFGVSIQYSIEESPLGTAGALLGAMDMLSETFVLLYGDTFIDVDLRNFYEYHKSKNATGTLFLHPNDHPLDSDLVRLDSRGYVAGILPYPRAEGVETRNLVNAALCVFQRSELKELISIDGKTDVAKDLLPRLIKRGLRLQGYVSSEYIKDMGTPERLDAVEADYSSGLPEKLSTRHLRTAVFLDRDGTLIANVDHLNSPDQVELLPGVSGALRRLNCSGHLAVVVTNQPVVSRGEVSLDTLDKIHARLDAQLGVGGAYLDRLYYCPHHPERGYLGEIPELKIACTCRKPAPGMLNLASDELKIDKRKSWMIGDTNGDIEAGRRAGVSTILLRTGRAGRDTQYATRPDYIFADLPDAADWILEGHGAAKRKLAQMASNVCNGKRLVLIGGLARSGKTVTAQVLKELLTELERKAHVICLDGWLKPKLQRFEGSGVLDRYDLNSASTEIGSIARSKKRKNLNELLYDRYAGVAGPMAIEHSIGPEDILIVEGVPALLMNELIGLEDSVRIYMDAARNVREERLIEDYSWRGQSKEHFLRLISMRDLDETPLVEGSRRLADFIFDSNITNA